MRNWNTILNDKRVLDLQQEDDRKLQQIIEENRRINENNIKYDKLFEKLKPGTLLKVKKYSECDKNTIQRTVNNPETDTFIQECHLNLRLCKSIPICNITVHSFGLSNFEGHKMLSDKDKRYYEDVNLVIPDEILMFVRYIDEKIPKYQNHYYFSGKNTCMDAAHREFSPRILCFKAENNSYVQLPSTILHIL